MALGLIGRKVGMMRWFDERGNAFAATVVQAEPNVVVQVRTPEWDGYTALQLGYGRVKDKNVTQPMKGHFARAGVEPKRYLREFRVEDVSDYDVGQEITVEIFQEGEKVDVSGISKGKGFQGVMKRHGFSGGPASHGSDSHRRPGSIGSMAATGKVFKGKKMAGHMGAERVTVQGLSVLKTDPAKNLIVLRGAIPGPRGALVELRKGRGS
jgi:large subunit ribosomal protein L3